MSLDRYSSLNADASVYTDLTGLQKIKQLGKGDAADRDQALEQVAKQFESVFLGMMMKSMRDANSAFEDKEMSGSNEMQFYQQMFDQQLTLSLSQNGVGIAEAIARQLKQGGSAAAPAEAEVAGLDLNHYFDNVIQKIQQPRSEAPEHSAEPMMTRTSRTAVTGELTPESFKEKLMPVAQQAAAALGVDAEVLLSQAALESGWGKHMIRDQYGRNSYNLFGIKADSRWQGEKAVVTTLEYRKGLPVQEKASFRAYNSYEESFQDYVAFLQGQNRYQDALNAVVDPVEYVNGLQQAGYATDPQYAEKILDIMKQHFPANLSDKG